MDVLLISTYELGRQPFGLASPAALLREAGHSVTCIDASRTPISLEAVRRAQLIAFYLPMHTATRLALPLLGRVRSVNSQAHVCAYGLYAPLNADLLRQAGVQSLIGGEFEQALVRLAAGESLTPPLVQLERIAFAVPQRHDLPPLSQYAALDTDGDRRVTGYTEASRGCKHLCRHCPIVPVYEGKFRIVPPEIVLADIRAQVLAGARHITLGDPDFFNGPAHARRIIEAFHSEWPSLTYDVTIKIEHLLRHRDLLPLLRDTGCILVTSAVESIDDNVLALLRKGHTRAHFCEAVDLCRRANLTLSPTFIPFTPWTTLNGYRDLLATLAAMDLIPNVAPIQLALRLLITAQSPLLELPDVQQVVWGFNPVSLVHPWQHPDPAIDALATRLLTLVDQQQKLGASRADSFAAIWREANGDTPLPPQPSLVARAAVPYLTEPWYC
jgi:radical SAM superfamily enzyme YgiQ (UPF0313 family)